MVYNQEQLQSTFEKMVETGVIESHWSAKEMNLVCNQFKFKELSVYTPEEVKNLLKVLHRTTYGYKVDFVNDLNNEFNTAKFEREKEVLANFGRTFLIELNDAKVGYGMAFTTYQPPAKGPQPLQYPDYSKLRKTAQEYVDQLATDGTEPRDVKQYIYEAAMEAIYGKKIWDFINERSR